MRFKFKSKVIVTGTPIRLLSTCAICIFLSGCAGSYFNPDPVADVATSFKNDLEMFNSEFDEGYGACFLMTSLSILTYTVSDPDFKEKFDQSEMKQLLNKIAKRANEENIHSEQYLSYLRDLETNISEDKNEWSNQLDEFTSMFCPTDEDNSTEKDSKPNSSTKGKKQGSKASTREKLNQATGLDFQPHNQIVSGLANLPIIGRWETWLATGTKCFAAQFELASDASMVEEQWRFMYPSAKIFLIRNLNLVVYDSSVSGSCAIDVQNELGGA